MNRYETEKKNFLNELRKMKEEGFKVYVSKNLNYLYGCIEKEGALLYVQTEDLFFGYTYTLPYKSKYNGNGNGCRAGEKVYELTPENFKSSYEDGWKFAHSLGEKPLNRKQIEKYIEDYNKL